MYKIEQSEVKETVKYYDKIIEDRKNAVQAFEGESVESYPL